MTSRRLAFLATLAAGMLSAQTLQFEAASIRPSGPRSVSGTDGGPGSSSPERWVFGEATIAGLLTFAYDVEDFQIDSKIPLEKETFDLAVKMPAGTTKPQFRLMLQNLLAERFHLKLHVERRDFPGYELVVAKSGHKLTESAAGTPFRNAPAPDGFPQLPAGRPGMANRNSRVGGYVLVRLAARRQPVSQLAGRAWLQTPDYRPIVDNTSLTGTYDFTFEYTMETDRLLDGPPPAPDLLTAVREQLGLELVSKKIPFDVLVIESVNRTPTEN